MFSLQDISYIHPNKELLFSNVNLTINSLDKTALIGNNGVGKSTLLRIIAAELQPSSGSIFFEETPFYIPQNFGQFSNYTVAQALKVDEKLNALNQILKGNVCEENYNLLDNDWSIEERCNGAMDYWQIMGIGLSQKMGSLSGGEKTKILLASIMVHNPNLILMDEPSNHLDMKGKELLYKFVESARKSFLIVSHDRKLLNLTNKVCELTKSGTTVYGGNFNFYLEQKQIDKEALNRDIQNKEGELRKAKERERIVLERLQRSESRGKKKQVKSGLPRIMINTLKSNAQNSTSRLKGVHESKTGDILQELRELRAELPGIDKIKFQFDHSILHKGKILFKASAVNFSYGSQLLWDEDINLIISSGERIAIAGDNGSGKTTLIKIILGDIEPIRGAVYRAIKSSIYIDQDYTLIENSLSVYEQVQKFNSQMLQEHDLKIRLNRFLFGKDYWDKPCSTLSGGERMRLMLCCLTTCSSSPDIIVLDEPTNNLDIQNVEILISAINEYKGTLIVVSHDEYFLEQIKVERIVS